MPKTKLVIGIDEAGYGPNMGPLVVCGTAWRVPNELDMAEVATRLEPEFLSKPIRSNSEHVPIGDSKKINKDTSANTKRNREPEKSGELPSHNLDASGTLSLDRGVRFLSSELQILAKRRGELIQAYSPLDFERLNGIPWYADTNDIAANLSFESMLPSDQEKGVFASAAGKLKSLSMKLAGIQMRVLDEPEYNRQVEITQNKSSTLSELSLNLVRDIISAFAKGSELIEVFCDKHGGRNRYQAVLSHCFDQQWFSIQTEGAKLSRYEAHWNQHPVQIQFKVDGDSIFPSAAASVVAKWTREEMMRRLNRFWQSNFDNTTGTALRPTAGYYVDATRFAKDIASTADKLKLQRENWWRKK